MYEKRLLGIRALSELLPNLLINPTTEPYNSSYLVAAFAIGADLIEVGESKDISDRQSHSMSTCATL